jgi:sirohydrochlorin cobaltochelatase
MRAVILFGHGSRDASWRQPMDAVAALIRARAPEVPVRCAFLDLEPPDLATAAADLIGAGATRISIVPMFLGAGRHMREDLPRLVESLRQAHRSLELQVHAPVGENPRVLDLLASIALE